MLTTVGVLLTSILTIVGFALTAAVFALADSVGVSSGVDGVVRLWLSSLASAFIGGAALGFAQVPSLPVGTPWLRWMIATMCGSAAVGPVAFTVISGACGAYGVPLTLLGAGGGLIYGTITALALPALPKKPG